MVNRGAGRWKQLAPAAPGADGSYDSEVAALLGVIYLPDPDNQTAAIQLLVAGTAVEQRFDAAGQPKTVVLDLAGDKRTQATLVVRSHARGMLTLANLVQEYTST
jgi:hypothetical protein